MTAAEARRYADQGMTRWAPVATALTALEDGARQADSEPQPLAGLNPDWVISYSGGLKAESSGGKLIDDVRVYAAETGQGQEHVDRWMRVLAAFGEDNGYEPMSAAEAKTYADKGWTRWDPVVEVLEKLESAQRQIANQPEPEPVPEPDSLFADYEPDPASPAAHCLSDDLLADVQGYAREIWHGTEHVERWLRVLQTFSGTASADSKVSSADAERMARRFSASRWNPVSAALRCLEERAAP